MTVITLWQINRHNPCGELAVRLDPSPSMLSSQCCQGTPSHYKNYSTSQPLFNASQRLIGRKHVSGSRRSRSAGGDTDSSAPPSSSPTDWRRISYYQERSPDELHPRRRLSPPSAPPSPLTIRHRRPDAPPPLPAIRAAVFPRASRRSPR